MIRLKSLLESVEFTPKGNLRIDNVNDISPDKWEEINHIMVNKDYAMRGGQDCKRAVAEFLSNPNNKEPNTINPEIYGTWVDTIAMVMGVDHKSSEGPKYNCQLVIRSAARAFGITNNIREAGYILPSGRLLSLTGNSNR